MKTLHLIASFVIAIAYVPASTAVDDPNAVKITTIRAMPFYPATGVIRRSTNLFDKRLALRNIIMQPSNGMDPHRRAKIEDWDIEFGTTATYVEIEVETALTPMQAARIQVEVLARFPDSRREPQMQSVGLSALISTAQRQWHIPFFVYGTGCERLEIVVRLLSAEKAIDTQSRIIPFSCGE